MVKHNWKNVGALGKAAAKFSNLTGEHNKTAYAFQKNHGSVTGGSPLPVVESPVVSLGGAFFGNRFFGSRFFGDRYYD